MTILHEIRPLLVLGGVHFLAEVAVGVPWLNVVFPAEGHLNLFTLTMVNFYLKCVDLYMTMHFTPHIHMLTWAKLTASAIASKVRMAAPSSEM